MQNYCRRNKIKCSYADTYGFCLRVGCKCAYREEEDEYDREDDREEIISEEM